MKLHYLIALLLLGSIAQLPTAEASQTSAPQQYEEAYQHFKKALEEQAAGNSTNPCPAITIALKATNDEFCIDEWMKRAADEGNPVALNFIGTKHLFYVPDEHKHTPEVKEAVAMVKKAADKKYVPAMVDYSTFLRNGVGVIKNTAAADRMLLEACKAGNFETRFSWLLQTDRLATYEDLQRPEVKGELERGNHHILYYMSGKAPDRFTMISMLTQAARMGNHSAMYELSMHLSQVDIKTGYHYLKVAAAQHNPMAISVLGQYLVSPEEKKTKDLGMQKDAEAGVYMLKIAGMLGNTAAHSLLSHMYYHGLWGIPKDINKAYRHVEEGSASRPDVGFMTAMGYMLMKGEGVNQDTEKGKELISVAAKQHYPHALAMMAYINFRGIGTPPNPKEAVYMLESMAIQGLDVCFVFLALMYDEGVEGLPKDPKKTEYYMGHAKRAMGEYAQQVFDRHKKQNGGWYMAPFDLPV